MTLGYHKSAPNPAPRKQVNLHRRDLEDGLPEPTYLWSKMVQWHQNQWNLDRNDNTVDILTVLSGQWWSMMINVWPTPIVLAFWNDNMISLYLATLISILQIFWRDEILKQMSRNVLYYFMTKYSGETHHFGSVANPYLFDLIFKKSNP